jgi:hypothetical protein
MKTKLLSAFAILLCLDMPGFAHRLDEYLEAAMISIERDRVQISMRLVPGVAVLPVVLASIDTNRDGQISESEGQAYAQRIVRDLSLSVNGLALHPKIESVKFPSYGEMKEGLGEIHLELTAVLPADGGSERKLVLRNQHQSQVAAYLVNCLVPRDQEIHVISQNRNQNQSFYELDYSQGAGTSAGRVAQRWSAAGWFNKFGGFVSMFQLGMRHIAEGTDHLLFLLALLLPAPLVAMRARWAEFASVRQSVGKILRVVTAFTVGHSLTLALAGLGVVLVPSRPIEVLIAVSILVSAVHALRPIFPGREPWVAASFGLIHGLAFAATLGQLGLERWMRVANIFAFNVGIETMQLIVVAAAMPSLLLLSRTRAYSTFRIGGALFAGAASIGWIAERLLHLNNSVDGVVDAMARQAGWIAGFLFLASVLCWCLRNGLSELFDWLRRQRLVFEREFAK